MNKQLKHDLLTALAAIISVVGLFIVMFSTSANAYEVDYMMIEKIKVICLDSIYVDENMIEI